MIKLIKFKKKDPRKRQYKQEMREVKRRLRAAIKNYYGIFDYGWVEEIIEIQIQHWKQYYALRYNVQAMEDRDAFEWAKDRPTRYEIACELEKRYNAYRNSSEFDKSWSDLRKEFYDYWTEYGPAMWD